MERIRDFAFWAFAALLLFVTFKVMRIRTARNAFADRPRPGREPEPKSEPAATTSETIAPLRLLPDLSPASVSPARLSALSLADRIELAERVSGVQDAPARLVELLLRDDPAVAAPLLRGSLAIDDNTLLALIRNGTREHRVAIAERLDLAEPLVTALLEAGEPDVTAELMENPGARFGALAQRRLPPVAETPEELAAPLESAPPESVETETAVPVQAAAPSIQIEVTPGEPDAPIVAPKSQADGHGKRAVAEMDMPAHVAAALLAEVRRRRDVPFFEAVLGELSGLRSPLLQRVLYEKTGRDLAQLVAALGLGEEVFCDLLSIAQGAPRESEAPDEQRAAALRQYRAVSDERARQALAQWIASNPPAPEVYRG